MMGPYDPHEVELFAALNYCSQQEKKYGASGWEDIRSLTKWCAW